MEKGQEGKLDGEQGNRQQGTGRCLEPQTLLEERDEFRRDVKGGWIDILRDVDVGDVEVQGRRARDEGHDGEVEKPVVDGNFASLYDADVGATDGESDGDTQEDADADLLLVNWQCGHRRKRNG